MRRIVFFISLLTAFISAALAADPLQDELAHGESLKSEMLKWAHPTNARYFSTLQNRIQKLRTRLYKNIVHRRTLERQRLQLERTMLHKRRQIQGLHGDGKEFQDAEVQYKQLVAKKGDLRRGLNMLNTEAEELVSAKNDILERFQHLNLEGFIERHASGLPDPMLGALRKSALVLTPFFDTLFTAADTNNRLVDHVGAEIDKYTHINIHRSPFMSGMLFYCVLLIPVLTLALLLRTVIDSSTKLSASHIIIFGNIYFIALCGTFIVATLLQNDPMRVLYIRYESFVIIANLALALYYVWYLAMLGVHTLNGWDNRNLAQFVAATTVGIHYFLFAWRRVFTDHAPQLYAHNYLVYATIFAFITYERSIRINARWLLNNPILRRLRATDIKLDSRQLLQTTSKHACRYWQALQIRIAAALESIRLRHWIKQRRRRGQSPNEEAPRIGRQPIGYALPIELSSDSSSSGEDSDDSIGSLTVISRMSEYRTSFSGSHSSNEAPERPGGRPQWWIRWWSHGEWSGRNQSAGERAVAAAKRPRERVQLPLGRWSAWQLTIVRMLGGFGWFGATPEKQRISPRVRRSSRRTKHERNNARPRRERREPSWYSEYLWKWT